jgi:hypothetical protein
MMKNVGLLFTILKNPVNKLTVIFLGVPSPLGIYILEEMGFYISHNTTSFCLFYYSDDMFRPLLQAILRSQNICYCVTGNYTV